MADQTGIIVLPKIVKGSGKATMTAIAADEIKGIEPCKVSYGPKVYDGAKVYTVHGTYFKSPVNPVSLVQGWHLGKSDPKALVTMDSLAAIPSYTDSTKVLLKAKN